VLYTHSIPGYAITLNAPANKHTALASTTHTSDTPHTHPITTTPLNSSVLYSPPPVLVDSTQTPQIRMESARSPQIRAESVQSSKIEQSATLCSIAC
jgi:hypothetical protein